MKQGDLTAFEKVVTAVTRLYPLRSGCGSLATTRLMNRLVPPRNEAVIGRVRGRRCLAPLDDLVGRAIILVGDLDPKVTWVIDQYVKPNDITLDIGANLGLVTLLLGTRLGGTGKILMFEPSPEMHDFLAETLKNNQDLPAKLFPFALGSSEGMLTLTIPEENAGRASLLAEAINKPRARYDVAVQRLSSVLRSEGVTRVDLMKIDVEGFEAEVLAGLFDDPAAPRPKLILFEENRPEDSFVFGSLAALDYQIYGLPMRLFRPTLVPQGHREFHSCHDFVAVHASTDPDRLQGLGVR